MPGINGKRKRADVYVDGELVALHRARVVEWSPTAVTALAATADGTVVAVARESGSIELWTTEHWQCIKRIPGKENSAISCLAWTFDKSTGRWRLFSGGLDGLLTEWELTSLQASTVSDSNGGAIWSLAVDPQQGSPQRVAVACDDGALRIFEAQDGVPGLQYAKTFQRTEGRVLSAAWHPDSSTIITGTSTGVMHAWEVSFSRELLRITAGNGSGAELCIWSVLVLPDGTMVSGDSTGSVQLWDSQHGTLLQAFTQHKADVMAVAASTDGNTIFATGIDVQVACFRKLAATSTSLEKWVYLDTRRPHTHDVRAMLVLTPPDADPLLLTGANDAQLFAYSVRSFQTRHPVRVCKVPQRPGLHLAAPSLKPSQPVSLLAVQPLHVDLWQTGCTAEHSKQQKPKADLASLASLTALPTHLARIKKTGTDHIICGALSSDGGRLAFSEQAGLHVYELSSEAIAGTDTGADAQAEEIDVTASSPSKSQQAAGGQAERKLVHLAVPERLPTFHELHFRPGASQLVGLTAQGSLLIVDMDTAEVVAELKEIVQPLQLSYQTLSGSQQQQQLAAAQLTPTAALLTVSSTGRWAAVAGASHVHIFDLESRSYHGRLPALQDSAPLTALTFSANGEGLITANASNHIAVYNVQTLSATNWTKTHGSHLPSRLLNMPGSIVSISVHPQAADIVVATPSSACHISLAKQLPAEEDQPNQHPFGKEYPYQSVNSAEGGGDAGENFKVMPMPHPILLLAYTSPSSLLLVDKPWEEVYKRLPEPLYRHRYGT